MKKDLVGLYVYDLTIIPHMISLLHKGLHNQLLFDTKDSLNIELV